MGSLEMIHDRFLAPGGVVFLGSVQMPMGDEPEKELQHLMGLFRSLVDIDSQVGTVFADGAIGVYSWWIQQKSIALDAPGLRLGRFLRYQVDEPIDTTSQKAAYSVNKLVSDAAGRYANAPIPSTKLCINDGMLDDASREKYATDLLEFRPQAELDLASTIAGWLVSAPSTSEGVDDSSGVSAAHDLVLSKFKQFDQKGDGYIDKRELCAVLKALDASWTATKVDAILKAIDVNNDGRIDFTEFLHWAFYDYTATNQDLRAFRACLESSPQSAARPSGNGPNAPTTRQRAGVQRKSSPRSTQAERLSVKR